MNSAIKNKWIEALRSGQYEQGHEQLRSNDDKFCCLGVLCDILQPDKWRKNPDYEHTHDQFAYLYGDLGAIPPDHILDTSGLHYVEAKRLAHMNDSGYSFQTIASYIENNL